MKGRFGIRLSLFGNFFGKKYKKFMKDRNELEEYIEGTYVNKSMILLMAGMLSMEIKSVDKDKIIIKNDLGEEALLEFRNYYEKDIKVALEKELENQFLAQRLLVRQAKIVTGNKGFSEDAEGYYKMVDYVFTRICTEISIGGAEMEKHYGNLIQSAADKLFFARQFGGTADRDVVISGALGSLGRVADNVNFLRYKKDKAEELANYIFAQLMAEFRVPINKRVVALEGLAGIEAPMDDKYFWNLARIRESYASVRE